MLARLWLMICGLPVTCMASQTAVYPWESTANKLKASLLGPTAFALSLIAIGVCGYFIMFGDLQSGSRKAANVALGITLVIGAPAILNTLFGFSGALI